MRNLPRSLGLLLCLAPALWGAGPGDWSPHSVRQADGKGGWIDHPAQYQFIRHPQGGKYTYPFGILAMDNGEIVLAASWNDGSGKDRKAERPVVAFSRDGGRTWSDFTVVPDSIGRPMMLTDLGGGGLVFQTDPLGPFMPTEHFSHDYGHTWPEHRELQKAANGGTSTGGGGVKGFYGAEGNALVDRDAAGRAVRIAQIGWNFEPGSKWPVAATVGGILRWSHDGGRTWTDETIPAAWDQVLEYRGKSYTRKVSEGSLVRAANGWLVAYLRTDMPPRYLDQPNNDNLEGSGYSISKDEGRTWSPVKVLFDAGRMHGHLLELDRSDLMLTLIVRNDIAPGAMRRASDMQGCEVVLSHDNGLTWDLGHKYVVDAYDAPNPAPAHWFDGNCGHLSACVLRDGSILTVYGNYVRQGIALIHWRP